MCALLCIYIDVLLILNIYVNYFLLRATARLTHTVITGRRLAATAAIGSLTSLTILLPPLGSAANLLIKVIFALLIVFMAFGKRSLRTYLYLCGIFFAINFIFAGFIMALSIMFNPSRMVTNNSSLYIDFSLISLIIFTAAAYFAVCLVRRGLDKSSIGDKKYRIIIGMGEKSVDIPAISDSGNLLRDSFSGSPIIVCGFEELSKVIPCHSEVSELRGFRMIPCSTVMGGAVMPVFRPDRVAIYVEGNSDRKNVDALVGIVPKRPIAVFNPKLL